MLSTQIQFQIKEEVDRQQSKWDDKKNRSSYFACYIVHIATRFMFPAKNPGQTFRVCMLKVAALAVSAINWYDSKHFPGEETEDELKVKSVEK